LLSLYHTYKNKDDEMSPANKLASLLLFAFYSLGGVMAAEIDAAPEEIIVTGRLPGPPLWKVSNGDKVLWIFPYLDWIPKDMLWDSERVARVIAQSQEVLSQPVVGWGASLQVRLNPISLVRNERLNNRIGSNPDGRTLEETLPPELYARFAALQARYFPGNEYFVDVRPAMAGRTMMNIIRKREGLVQGDDILKTIRRLERRNPAIKHTEISEVMWIDSFGEYAERVEALYENYPAEEELACFEQQVRHAEEDLDAMKNRANSWAQGYIDEFRSDPLVGYWEFDMSNSCVNVLGGIASPEREATMARNMRVSQMWLDAAENALATNASTFAILHIGELLAEDGLLSKLKAKGYEIREP